MTTVLAAAGTASGPPEALTPVIAAAVVLLLIGRRTRGRPARQARMIIVPTVLLACGVVVRSARHVDAVSCR